MGGSCDLFQWQSWDLTRFPPCPDWPVFSDLDNVAPRDPDHLDNHRVSGVDSVPPGMEAESSDLELGSPVCSGMGRKAQAGESHPPA